MITNQLGGQVDYTIEALSAVLPQIEAGKMRLLAVTSPERVTSYPNVPTLAESGAPGMDLVGWNALYVPAGTPPAIVEKLNFEMKKSFGQPRRANPVQKARL